MLLCYHKNYLKFVFWRIPYVVEKINAVLGLLNSVLILDHSTFYTLWMFSRGRLTPSAPQLPKLLVLLVVIHAVLSIVSAVRAHKNKQAKVRMYNRQNRATVLQRGSGIVMLLLLVLHIVGNITHFQPSWLHAVVHPVFLLLFCYIQPFPQVNR